MPVDHYMFLVKVDNVIKTLLIHHCEKISIAQRPYGVVYTNVST